MYVSVCVYIYIYNIITLPMRMLKDAEQLPPSQASEHERFVPAGGRGILFIIIIIAMSFFLSFFLLLIIKISSSSSSSTIIMYIYIHISLFV